MPLKNKIKKEGGNWVEEKWTNVHDVVLGRYLMTNGVEKFIVRLAVVILLLVGTENSHN